MGAAEGSLFDDLRRRLGLPVREGEADPQADLVDIADEIHRLDREGSG